MNLTDNNSEKVKNCARMAVDEVIAAFQVCDTGYSEREAELARRKYGSNDLTNQKKDAGIHCIRRAFVNPFSVVLFFLGVISLFADEGTEDVVSFIKYILGTILAAYQGKTRQYIAF